MNVVRVFLKRELPILLITPSCATQFPCSVTEYTYHTRCRSLSSVDKADTWFLQRENRAFWLLLA